MQSTSARQKQRISFELKYCERCGGLWLRPFQGRQIYCTGCSRAMAELPAPSREPEPQGNPDDAVWKVQRIVEEPGDDESLSLTDLSYVDEEEGDAAGGAA